MSIFFVVHFVVRSKHGDASIAIYTKMVGIGCDYYSTSNILFLIHSVSLPTFFAYWRRCYKLIFHNSNRNAHGPLTRGEEELKIRDITLPSHVGMEIRAMPRSCVASMKDGMVWAATSNGHFNLSIVLTSCQTRFLSLTSPLMVVGYGN